MRLPGAQGGGVKSAMSESESDESDNVRAYLRAKFSEINEAGDNG